MKPETSATDGMQPRSTNTKFHFAGCSHDELDPLIHSIWSSMRGEELLEASPAPTAPDLSLFTVLPCSQCSTKESRGKRIESWLHVPREDTAATRAELAWIGWALESLGSEKRPHLTRWAYVVAERLGADLALKLAICFRDASHPDGPLRNGAAARCLKDAIDDSEARKRVQTARRAREDLLAEAWNETTLAARVLEHQLEHVVHSGADLGFLNLAGENFIFFGLTRYGALVDETLQMPEGLINSSRAPRGDSSVQQESLGLQIQKNEVLEWLAIGKRLPSETGFEMLLPFSDRPSPDEAHRLTMAIKMLETHLQELRLRLGDFQAIVRETEYQVEAENADLPHSTWSIDDDE